MHATLRAWLHHLDGPAFPPLQQGWENQRKQDAGVTNEGWHWVLAGEAEVMLASQKQCQQARGRGLHEQLLATDRKGARCRIVASATKAQH